MKKFWKDCKAVAIPIIAVLVAVLLIVVGVVIVVMKPDVVSTKYWETTNEFGAWQDEIELGFTDGTTTTLKTIQDDFTLAVYDKYSGKEIDYVKYIIKAQASETGGGSGYSYAEVKTEDYKVRAVLTKTSGGGAIVYDNYFSVTDQTHNIAFDTVKQITAVKIDVNSKLYGWADADYNIGFSQSGNIEYRGYPDGTWNTASLPPDRGVDLEVKSGGGGQIVVTISSSTGTN